ncbi:MAG TPA: ASPIC/UnbV domain-containing protein, partial [Terriglobia bacterium]|nr:ASPIC/UnbV domain-containing protein [Terriglobia bacterium]
APLGRVPARVRPGEVVRVRSRGGAGWQTVRSGSSYCSSSELILTFGLGKATQADSVEITWPSGQRDTLKNLAANKTYTVEEGGKILATKAFSR